MQTTGDATASCFKESL